MQLMNEALIPEMIGEAPAFLDALAHASAVAALERPVLIAGERGTGKELLAARMHYLSGRWDGPFVKVNCAALSEELLESELFGHEAGAFTGATKRHAGRFERADGGTLFLDEIATTSMRIQEKLLRVIEYGEYERLGGRDTLMTDVRIVGAANVDLRALAASGKFRADLLDRLAFEVITAPPLRARQRDIRLLANHFASRFASELSGQGIMVTFDGFSREGLSAMEGYPWPGNVRELKNTAERAVFRSVMAGEMGLIAEIPFDPFESSFAPPVKLESPAGEASTIPEASSAEVTGDGLLEILPRKERAVMSENAIPQRRISDPYDLRDYLHDLERQLVEDALSRHGWNQRRAAEFLQLSYDQLRGIVRKHELKEGFESKS